jgi:hypothetical protein
METYVIRSVHKSADHSTIVSVKGSTRNTYGFTSFEHLKQDVIVRINSKLAEYRVYSTSHGLEVLGPLVNVVRSKKGNFLRIDYSNTEEDNLGELPEY